MSIVTRATLPLTADERRAVWAYRYAMGGHHRTPSKPRMRIKPRIRVKEPSASQ